MTTDVLVQVEQVSRYYSDYCAVDNISFTVRKGEVLGFLGPNGAGKTTTMRMISGNLAPSAGRILISGYDLLDCPKQAKAEIGYLPEQPPVYGELSVDEYLGYCARLNRIRAGYRDTAIESAKQRCGLGAVGRRLIANLSKGYQQRVGIAQAIIHRPAVVILDEPTVGLDPLQIREIRALIRELGQSHSVILSTHILPEVQSICDSVKIINRGELVFGATMEDLRHHATVDSIIIALRSPPPVAELAAIAGISAVESLAPGRLRLRYRPGQDPSEDLVKLSIAKAWGLYELTPERNTLEQIFVELISKEKPITEEAGHGSAAA